MKEVLELANKEEVNLVDLVEAVRDYLDKSAENMQCEVGAGKFVSIGAINHSMRVLQRAIEKSA